MSSLALVAFLLATPLVQGDAEAHDCKASLNVLAAAAHAALLATETADNLATKVDELQAKLDACTKEKGKGASACAKIAEKLESVEAEHDAAEDELTVALEDVDAAYDDFDVACSWDDADSSVQVRSTAPRHGAGTTVARAAVSTSGAASRR